MTAPSSIDPARFLSCPEQLAAASPDLLRSMLTTSINTLMSTRCAARRTGGPRRSGLVLPRARAGAAPPDGGGADHVYLLGVSTRRMERQRSGPLAWPWPDGNR